MMKFLIISFLMVFNFIYPGDNSYPDVMKVIDDYSKSLEIEQNIFLRGYGLHYAGKNKIYDGKIHVIDLGYSIDKRVQCEEAKKIFSALVDGLLHKINTSEKLKKYFYRSPVEYQDLYIRLSFDYESKGGLQKDDVLQAYILEGNKMNFLVLEQAEPSKMIQKKLCPDVFVLEGMEPKTRTISIDLPEKK